MTRYAVRAIPWGRVAAAVCLVLVLTELGRRWPGPTWGLWAVAVAVLAAAAAWCQDEPAARVVDIAPCGLPWRTAARLPAVVLLGAVWGLQVDRARDQLYGHAWEVLVQGLAAIMVANAWTAWLRARGAATPGARFATAVIPVVMVLAMVPLVSTYVWVFPFAIDPAWHWQVSHAGWLAAGALALVVLAAALADAPWWRIARRT